MLVNDRMFEEFRGMHIDEEKELLNISDHCLVRAWFKMGTKLKTNWKKTQMKEIQWVKKDEESLKKFETAFLPKIGKSTSFEGFMKKVKTTQDIVLKKRKRIKVGKRGKQKVTAAEWVDMELIDNINIRSKLSRRWSLARKQRKPK